MMTETVSTGEVSTGDQTTSFKPSGSQLYQQNIQAIKSQATSEAPPVPTNPGAEVSSDQFSNSDTVDHLTEIKSKYGDKTIPVTYKGKQVQMKISDVLANPAAIYTVNQAMNEKNQAVKLASDVLNGLKADPLKGLAALLNPSNPTQLPDSYKQQLIEQLLGQVPQQDRVRFLQNKIVDDINDINMSPEEKQRLVDQRELESYRKEKERRENEEKNNRIAQEFKTQQLSVLNEVAQEMNNLNLPQDDAYRSTILREAMVRMLKDIDRAKKTNSPRQLTVKSALTLAKNEVYEGFRKSVTHGDPATLIELLGPEVVEKVRQYMVDKHKARKRMPVSVTGNTGSSKPKIDPNAGKVKSYSDYKKNVEAMLKR